LIKNIIDFSRLALNHMVVDTRPLLNRDRHLKEAVDWLVRAHNATQRKGVSYGYSIKGGWRPPYRETTGYILVTFYKLARFLDSAELSVRATEMARWELSVQNSDGSFSNPRISADQGIVFDTGQVLFGLVKAYEETKDEEFMLAARRAGQWLVNVSDAQRRWTSKNTHNGIPHTYNSRTAWALLRLDQIDPSSEWRDTANSNLNFAVEQFYNGWLKQCAFTPNTPPFTHTIAYAIRGLLESARINNNAAHLEAATAVADSCINLLNTEGFLPGTISIEGETTSKYCCLTGNCQLSIIWAKLFQLTEETRYKESAISSLQYVMRLQNTEHSNLGIRGAISGSYPIWGAYSRLTFPNWATKFYVDAIIESWEDL